MGIKKLIFTVPMFAFFLLVSGQDDSAHATGPAQQQDLAQQLLGSFGDSCSLFQGGNLSNATQSLNTAFSLFENLEREAQARRTEEGNQCRSAVQALRCRGSARQTMRGVLGLSGPTNNGSNNTTGRYGGNSTNYNDGETPSSGTPTTSPPLNCPNGRNSSARAGLEEALRRSHDEQRATTDAQLLARRNIAIDQIEGAIEADAAPHEEALERLRTQRDIAMTDLQNRSAYIQNNMARIRELQRTIQTGFTNLVALHNNRDLQERINATIQDATNLNFQNVIETLRKTHPQEDGSAVRVSRARPSTPRTTTRRESAIVGAGNTPLDTIENIGEGLAAGEEVLLEEEGATPGTSTSTGSGSATPATTQTPPAGTTIESRIATLEQQIQTANRELRQLQNLPPPVNARREFQEDAEIQSLRNHIRDLSRQIYDKEKIIAQLRGTLVPARPDYLANLPAPSVNPTTATGTPRYGPAGTPGTSAGSNPIVLPTGNNTIRLVELARLRRSRETIIRRLAEAPEEEEELTQTDALALVDQYATDLSTVLTQCRGSSGSQAIAPLLGNAFDIATSLSGVSGVTGAALQTVSSLVQTTISTIAELFRPTSTDQRAMDSLRTARIPVAIRCTLEKFNREYCLAQDRLNQYVADHGTESNAAERLRRAGIILQRSGVNPNAVCYRDLDFSGMRMLGAYATQVDNVLHMTDEVQRENLANLADIGSDDIDFTGRRSNTGQRLTQVRQYLDHLLLQLNNEGARLQSMPESATKESRLTQVVEDIVNIQGSRDYVDRLVVAFNERDEAIRAHPRPWFAAGVSPQDYAGDLQEHRSARLAATAALQRTLPTLQRGQPSIRDILARATRLQVTASHRSFSDAAPGSERERAIEFVSLRDAEVTAAEMVTARAHAPPGTPPTTYQESLMAEIGMRGEVLDTIGTRLQTEITEAIERARARVNENPGDLASLGNLDGLCRTSLSIPGQIPSEIRESCGSIRVFAARRQGSFAISAIPTFDDFFRETPLRRRCSAHNLRNDHPAEIRD